MKSGPIKRLATEPPDRRSFALALLRAGYARAQLAQVEIEAAAAGLRGNHCSPELALLMLGEASSGYVFPETAKGATCAFSSDDEYDAAQERGEVAKIGDNLPSVPKQNAKPPTASDIGLSRKDIHEARLIRDANQSAQVEPIEAAAEVAA